jgi:hypothetical protein
MSSVNLELYSQQFIFFVTSEETQLARVLHNSCLERLAKGKQSSLLGPLLGYEENEVL